MSNDLGSFSYQLLVHRVVPSVAMARMEPLAREAQRRVHVAPAPLVPATAPRHPLLPRSDSVCAPAGNEDLIEIQNNAAIDIVRKQRQGGVARIVKSEGLNGDLFDRDSESSCPRDGSI